MWWLAAVAWADCTVVLATRDLERGHRVEADDVREVQIPCDPALPPDAFPRVSGEVLGARTVAPILAGDAVRAGRLLRGHGADLPEMIPLGMRAMAVPVDVAVTAAIRPGYYVDLLGRQATGTCEIGQVYYVLWVGPGGRERSPSLVLAARPSDVAASASVLRHGSVTVVLRNDRDMATADLGLPRCAAIRADDRPDP